MLYALTIFDGKRIAVISRNCTIDMNYEELFHYQTV